VYNNAYNYKAIFNMSGNAAICYNTVTHTLPYGGGVYNGTRFDKESIFNMSENAAICYNTVITGAPSSYGGGVVVRFGTTFNMLGGEISNNSGNFGGGVMNNGAFNMSGGVIENNTAKDYGGGVCNFDGTVAISGGKISGNTAESADSSGSSGGGIYTTHFSDLTVADGVVFSGNTAPTLRTFDLWPAADADGNGLSDIDEYENCIGDVTLSAVVLNALAGPLKNAPAYNNYDINYSGNVYVVSVTIVPEYAGYVTVTGNDGIEYGRMNTNGHAYIPFTVSSIILTADPILGCELIRFIIDGTTESHDNPTIVPITGNMRVVAEFTPLPPVNYTITADADKGSNINPGGIITVTAGDNKTFAFSAKHGYRITAVYVDGAAISSAELASGSYTFVDIKADHTITVVSKANGGSGGGVVSGSGSGDGGSGSGSGSGGGEPGDNNIGDSTGSGKWAVLNLICAVLAIITGVIGIIFGRGRIRKDNEEGIEDEISKAAVAFRILALIAGILSAIVFILTEDWTLPMALTDGWTLPMFVIFAASCILAAVSFRFDEKSEDEEPKA
jgi:hypothetical protein